MPNPQRFCTLEDRSALVEWAHLLECCLLPAVSCQLQWRTSARVRLQLALQRGSQDRVHVWWEDPSAASLSGVDRVADIRWGKARYGMLGLAPGYLESTAVPSLPNCLAQFCGLVLAYAEYQLVVEAQASALSPAPSPIELTNREQDILVSLAQGETEKQAARRLGISPHTVRTHRHRLYQCLHVHSPSEAVVRGVTLGLFCLLDVPAIPLSRDANESGGQPASAQEA